MKNLTESSVTWGLITVGKYSDDKKNGILHIPIPNPNSEIMTQTNGIQPFLSIKDSDSADGKEVASAPVMASLIHLVDWIKRSCTVALQEN